MSRAGFIYSSPKLERIQCLEVDHPCCVILLSNKEGQSTDICNIMGKSQKHCAKLKETQKSAYYVTPRIRPSRKGKIIGKETKQLFPGMWGGGRGLTSKGHEENLGSWK